MKHAEVPPTPASLRLLDSQLKPSLPGTPTVQTLPFSFNSGGATGMLGIGISSTGVH